MCANDREKVLELANINLQTKTWDHMELKVSLYKAVMDPVQTSCKVQKRFGE